MLKVIQVIKKKPEVSFEDFEKQIIEFYAENAKKIPGIKSFGVKLVRGGYKLEERPFDCVAEMEFADEGAFLKAVENPEMKSILEELSRVVEESKFIYSEEYVMKRARAITKPRAKKKVKRPLRKIGGKAGKSRRKARR